MERTHLYGVIDTQAGREIQMGRPIASRARSGRKAPPGERRHQIWRSPAATFCRRRFSIASSALRREAEAKFSSRMDCACLAQEYGLYALEYEGKSYDAGDKLGFLKATVEIALENPEFGEDFRAYLRELKL